jgi:hypothetical protein
VTVPTPRGAGALADALLAGWVGIRHDDQFAVGNLLNQYRQLDIALVSNFLKCLNAAAAFLVNAQVGCPVLGSGCAFRFCVHAYKYMGDGLYSQDFLYSNLLLAMSVQTGYNLYRQNE